MTRLLCRPLEKGVKLVAMKRLAVIILWAFALCVMAVTLAVLMTHNLSGQPHLNG